MTLAGSSLEEQRAIVGRHVVQERRDVLLPHRLDQRLLAVGRQVLEHGGGRPAVENAEGEHLIVAAQVAEDPGQLLRTPSLKLAAQRRKIA